MYYTCSGDLYLLDLLMKVTIKDHSIHPFLQPDDEVEFEPGRPIPNGRVCLVKIGKKHKVRQVFQEGEYYRLKPLNSLWDYKTEYVHVKKAETFVIAEASKKWLNDRWTGIRLSYHSQN